jgi:hypothetical protein
MKTKNVIIGLGILAVGIVGIMLWKKKKGSATSTTTSGGGSTTSGGGTTASTSTTKSTETVTGDKILQTIKDGTKGNLIVQVSKSDVYKSGDSVKLNTNKITGTYKIYYVYKGSTVMNLYLETPYVSGITSGTVSKA